MDFELKEVPEMKRIADTYGKTCKTLEAVGADGEQYVLVKYADLKLMVRTMNDIVKEVDAYIEANKENRSEY